MQTHEFIKALAGAGLTGKQAGIVDGKLATKQDLALLKQNLVLLRKGLTLKLGGLYMVSLVATVGIILSLLPMMLR